MGSIFARGSKLYAKIKAVDGTWKQIATGFSTDERDAAERWITELEGKVKTEQTAARSTGVSTAPALTVTAYAEIWIAARRALDLDWKNDEGRLRHHVLPRIGELPISEVRTRHIVDLVHWRRTTPLDATGDLPSARLVYNIYSVVSALFRDAKLADLIEQTPCCLDERQLGAMRDKDPEWRSTAVFARDEVESIISHPKIPTDRQVVYGLELLAGVRPGEAAALRWRHYDPSVQPLGKLLVAHAYNTRKHRAKGTKTETVKHVPVHPTLAAILAEWKLGGWAAMMGRPPEPDDLIVPLPPEAAARRRTREGEAFRGHDYSGKRWREEDLPALGWRHRRHYDMRATFITLALEDGADPEIIESRVTHTKRSRSAFHGYDRGERWAQTCREVVKLNVQRRPREAVSVAVGAALVQSTQDTDDVEEISGGGGSRTCVQGHATTRHAHPSHLVLVADRDVVSPSTIAGLADAPSHGASAPDRIVDALDRALASWKRARDERALRRELMRLLAELD